MNLVSSFGRGCRRVGAAFARHSRAVAVGGAVLVGVAAAPSAMATPVVIPDIDLGIDPTSVTDALKAVLVPFLVAAISIGFSFFAVKYGVRLIKSWSRG